MGGDVGVVGRRGCAGVRGSAEREGRLAVKVGSGGFLGTQVRVQSFRTSVARLDVFDGVGLRRLDLVLVLLGRRAAVQRGLLAHWIVLMVIILIV